MFLYLGGRFVQALRRAFFEFFNSSIITFAIPRCPDKIGVRTFCEWAGKSGCALSGINQSRPLFFLIAESHGHLAAESC